MHTQENGITPKPIRRLRFSNPNVLFKGIPFGTELENNACSVQNQGCIAAGISNYPCGDNNLLVGFFTPEGCNPITLYAGILYEYLTCPNAALYKFSYTFSPMGFNYVSPCGDFVPTSTQQCLFNIAPFPVGGSVYVKVELYDNNHNLLRVFKQVFTPDCPTKPGGPKEKNSQASVVEVRDNNLSFKIAPNPVHSQLGIDFDEIQTTKMNIRVVSVGGQELYAQKIDFDISPSNKQLLDISNLLSGTYLLEIYNNQSIGRKIFIKQ